MSRDQFQQLLELDVEGVLPLVGDVPTVRILLELSQGSRRFSEFALDVSSKTLSKKLKLLEEHGMVSRTAYAEIPPRVEYALTAKGQEFCSILDGVLQWENSWKTAT